MKGTRLRQQAQALEIVLDNQSSPSYRPSPLVAQVAWMNHCRFLNEWSPSLSAVSAADIAWGKSDLLERTSKTPSRSSSSDNILLSSSFASVTRSRSLLSTTKMIPCVF